jgi:O-antigen/teichoic acid export membrane protein
MAVGKQAFSSTIWSTATQVSRQGVSLIVAIILARNLTPEDFGIIAMVTVFTGFLWVFRDFGAGSYLIFLKNENRSAQSTAFWLSVILGLILFAILWVTAPIIAEFYRMQLLVDIARYLALSFLIGGVTQVSVSLLQRDLKFKKLFFMHLIPIIGSGGVAVYMAISGYGVWSLVVQTLVMYALQTLLLLVWGPKIYLRGASTKAFQDIMSYSLPLLGTNTLNYWVRNVDNLLIGKVLGQEALGFYSRAYSFLLIPVSAVTQNVTAVLFPAISSMKEDKERVRKAVLRVLELSVLISFPTLTFSFFFAMDITVTILGVQWNPIVPLIEVFCAIGIIQTISSFMGPIYLSQGATRLQFVVGTILRANTIFLIVIGLQFGVIAVAWFYLLAVCINFLPNTYYAGRLIALSPLNVLIVCIQPFLLSVLAALAAYLFCSFFIDSHFNRLGLGSVLMVVNFGLLNLAFNRSKMRELIHQLSEYIK